MTSATLKGLLGRKLRTALTALAIVLGVAMISGAYVVTDTMLKASDELKAASYGTADAVVSGRQVFKPSDNSGPTSGTKAVPEALVAKVRSVPQVAFASPEISDTAKLTGKNGKVIDSNGGPPFAVGFETTNPQARALSPLKIKSGAYPTRPTDVAIDAGTAKKKHYKVGDSIGVVTQGPVQQFKITGIVTFGGVDSIGSASASLFSLQGAQQLFHRQGRVDSILIKSKPGVTAAEVRKAIAPILPATAQVQSAQSQDRFDLSGLDKFLKILRTALIAFGFVSLFVGAFIIFNTLSITVAQRQKEFGLLRMIGASRRQVLGSVVLEAVITGLIAAVVGILVGLGLAQLIQALFTASGIDLPTTSTVFETRTAIVGLLVGVGVTTVAGLIPAVRATRIAPVAALREGSVDTVRKRGKIGWTVTGLATALGVGLLVYGIFAGGITASSRLIAMGIGCLVLFIGVAMLSPQIARPLASKIGWVFSRFGGSAGRLARENAMRNPHRTATTAAALMIGIALVTFVAVLGHGLQTSYGDALDKQVKSAYVVTAPDGFAPFSAGAADTLAKQPGVTSASIREDQVKAFGKKDAVDGIDPAAGQLLKFDWAEGSNASLEQLDGNGAIVTKKYADKHHLRIGSTFTAQTPSGDTLTLVVRGVQKRPEFNPLGLASIEISRATFDKTFDKPQLRYIFVGGTAGKAQLEAAVNRFPDAKVWTLSAYKDDQNKQFNSFLNILYALLALSVIVSLFGIVNTLVLSVFERTRELGMLRAVGMTRRQVRRMVRAESIITALIGAVLGMVVGVFLSALVTKALSKEGVSFAIPVGTLIAFLVVAAIAGVLAAIWPARRASRLNVLNALQYE